MRRPRHNRSGFAMLFVFVLAAAVSIVLYREVPRVVFQAQRTREQTLIDHGEQYKRAIQLYVRKFKRYPGALTDLESSQGIRFLRRRYKDPMTGKDEWRLIHTDGNVLTDSKVQKNPALQGQTTQNASNAFIQPTQLVADAGQVNDVLNARLNALAPRPSDRPAVDANAMGQTAGDPDQPPPADAQSQAQWQTAPQSLPLQPGQQPINPGQLYPGQPGQQPMNPGQPGQQPMYPAGQPVQLQVQPGQPGTIPQPGQPFPQAGFPGQQQYPTQIQPQPAPIFPQGQRPFFPGQNPGQNPGQFPGQNQPPSGFPVAYPVSAASSQSGSPANINLQGSNAALKMIQDALTRPRPGGLAGVQSQSQSPVIGAGIAGVATNFEGESIKVYNEREKYDEWEFVYTIQNDPTAMRAGMPGQQAMPGQQGPGGLQPSGLQPGQPGGLQPGGLQPGGLQPGFPPGGLRPGGQFGAPQFPPGARPGLGGAPMGPPPPPPGVRTR